MAINSNLVNSAAIINNRLQNDDEHYNIQEYETTTEKGLYNLQLSKTYFNNILMNIEDEIIVNNSQIDYSDVKPFLKSSANQLGYQYVNLTNMSLESNTTVNLFDIKKKSHTISLPQQSNIDLQSNTLWNINIDVKNILKEYLFAKIKNIRVFKGMKHSDVRNSNINLSIYDFIELNLLNKYKMSNIDFYVYYENILYKNINNNNKLQFNPIFKTEDVYKDYNKIKNVGIVVNPYSLDNILLNYNQTKPSKEYKFDYYFDLTYTVI